MTENNDKGMISAKEIIKLEFPIRINGVVVNQLSMRRPKLKDIRDAAKVAGKDEEERELRLFSMLTDCATTDIEELDLADYRNIQNTFQKMVGS